MKQTEQDIKNILHRNLDETSCNRAFSNIWASHLGNSNSKFKYKRAALVPMVIIITLLTLCTVGYAGLSRLTDDINLPFVDQPEIIGNWQTVDLVSEINDFNPESKSYQDELYLSNLVFIKSGQMLDSFENGNLFYSESTWTNGVVISPEMKTASKYEIKEIDGSKYMFMEWKSGDYVLRFLKPKYYVLKQIDAKDYSNFVVTKIEDNIDYEFANNTDMLGLWQSVDFVKNIEDFNPSGRKYQERLYLKELQILENGKLSFKDMDDKITTTVSSWTGDLIINHQSKTASKCTIKTIDSETYMFFEWKSGDYIYRGMKPNYYVLKKVQ